MCTTRQIVQIFVLTIHVFGDAERRRTWIYEVPLPYTHRLRNLLNMSAAEPISVEELRRFDLPVIASCVKVCSPQAFVEDYKADAVLQLYLLELATSLIPSNLYNDVKAIYPSGKFRHKYN